MVPREQLGRLEALIDVLVAQLAQTDAERWHQLRRAMIAGARLQAALTERLAYIGDGVRLTDAGDHADQGIGERARWVAETALRWLQREEPTVALTGGPVDLHDDNTAQFARIRALAEQRHTALRALKSHLDHASYAQLKAIAGLRPSDGLSVLPQVLSGAPVYEDAAIDAHIRSMLTDAEAWCAPRGGRRGALVGLMKVAEAAVLASYDGADPLALFGRYAGAPEVCQLADVPPDAILAFDAVFARGAPAIDPPLRAAEQQLPAHLEADVRIFFEARLATAAQLKLALPNRAFDALNVRIGASRMRTVAAALDAAQLHYGFERLGADAFARAIVQAGPPAVAQLIGHLNDVEAVQSVLAAFEPVGHGLGALLKTVSSSHLLQLVQAIGPAELRRQAQALGADGLAHLIASVGFPGGLTVLSDRPTCALLRQLRKDLGRRSVRLTLQAARGTEVARLLRRGLSAQQLQALMLGAEKRSPGLGRQVIRRLAALAGSDPQLPSRVDTLNEAMAWSARPDAAFTPAFAYPSG